MKANVNRKVESAAPRFLSGWKEIANYLGKGVRTVQRYERDFGLPVRRPAGKPWGSVLATKPELDAWVTASPIREAFHLAERTTANGSLTAEIKSGLDKMLQLRDQMLALRGEVKTSVKLLRESLHLLQAELNQNRWHEDLSTHRDFEPDWMEQKMDREMFDESANPLAHRKVS